MKELISTKFKSSPKKILCESDICMGYGRFATIYLLHNGESFAHCEGCYDWYLNFITPDKIISEVEYKILRIIK